MNPKNQKQQNTNPDFDFIVNSGPEPELKTKKPLDKKIILIIILVVLSLLIIVASTLIGANKKVQKSGDSPSGAQKNSVNIASQKEIVQKYIQAMSTDNITEAKTYLIPNEANNQRDLPFEYTDLWQKIDPKQCQIIDSESSVTKIRVNCIYIKDKLLAFSFVISTDDSGFKIAKYTLWIVIGATND